MSDKDTGNPVTGQLAQHAEDLPIVGISDMEGSNVANSVTRSRITASDGNPEEKRKPKIAYVSGVAKVKDHEEEFDKKPIDEYVTEYVEEHIEKPKREFDAEVEKQVQIELEKRSQPKKESKFEPQIEIDFDDIERCRNF